MEGEGPRYLGVTPRPGSTPVALLVTGVNPEVSCVSLYVQVDGRLGPNPVYRLPSGPGGWDTAHVRGQEIAPSRTYAVQAQCDMGGGTIGLSTPATGTTWQWADSDNSGGLVTIGDVVLIMDGFRQRWHRITLYAVDLWGTTMNPCVPQLVIDMWDATAGMNAFRRVPYTCGDPCP